MVSSKTKKFLGVGAVIGIGYLFLKGGSEEKVLPQSLGGGFGNSGAYLSNPLFADTGADTAGSGFDFGAPSFQGFAGSATSGAVSTETNRQGEIAQFPAGSNLGVILDDNGRPVQSTSRDLFKPIASSGGGSGGSSGNIPTNLGNFNNIGDALAAGATQSVAPIGQNSTSLRISPVSSAGLFTPVGSPVLSSIGRAIGSLFK